MQQFMVPQFIDVEDKIIGPITTRQFVLLLISVLIAFVFYRLFSFWYFVAFSLLEIGLFCTIAFVRINGRPVHFFLLNFLQTMKRPKVRLWNRAAYVLTVNVVVEKLKETVKKPAAKEPISGTRLSDLTLTVNTGGVYAGEEETPSA